jgi:hypothetical protein
MADPKKTPAAGADWRSCMYAAGALPGRPCFKMLKMCGQPVESDRERGRFLEYYVEQSYSGWYQFSKTQPRITSVGVICQP